MSLSLGAFVVVLLIYCIYGLKKGFLSTLGSLASLIIAYAAAFIFIKPVAQFFQRVTAVDGLAVYALSGLIIFTLVSLAVTAIFNSAQRVIEGPELSIASRVGGLILGAALGSVLGLIAVYAVDLMAEARRPASAHETQINPTPLEQTARNLIGKAVGHLARFIYPEAAPFAVSFVQSPITISKSLHNLATAPELQQILKDDRHQQLLEAGNAQAFVHTPEFVEIMSSKDMQVLLRDAKLVPEGVRAEEVVAQTLVEAWQGLDKIRQDPRVLAIMKDPEFQNKLQTNNTLALMNDPKTAELLNAFLQAMAKPSASTESSPTFE